MERMQPYVEDDDDDDDTVPEMRNLSIGSNIVPIDPEGDVVVQVGDIPGERLMRISSKQVSTVSKVFKAMLGPNWIDNPTTYTSNNPLLLPEDDPQAMEFLFKMAHFKISGSSLNNMPTDSLFSLLVSCDKYDCFYAFRSWLEPVSIRWYHEFNFFAGKNDLSNTLKGIGIAELFNNTTQMCYYINCLYGCDAASVDAVKHCVMTGSCTIMSNRLQDCLVSKLQVFMSRFKEVFWDKLEGLVHDLKMQYFCEHVETRLIIVEDAILQIEQGYALDLKSDITFESLRQSAQVLVNELVNKTSRVPQCGDESCRGCYQIDLRFALQHIYETTARTAFQAVSCGHPYGL